MLPPEILARAQYLHERIRELSKSVVEPGASEVQTEPASSGLAGSRHSPATAGEADFLFWKKQLSGTGYDRFAERLHSLGISEQDAVFLSQKSSFPAEQPGNSAAIGLDRDKGWDELFQRALEQPTLHLDGGDAFPFAKLWWPLVSLALQTWQALASNT